MRGAASIRPEWRARSHRLVRGTAGCARAADDGGAGLPAVQRGRAAGAGTACLALQVAGAWRFRRRGGDAGRGLCHPPRATGGARPSRRGPRHAARPAGIAAARPDVGRCDSRGRRLPRGARTGRDVHRHDQRGLRDRKHGGRHLSARQRLLADPARVRRHGSRGGCPRCAAHDSLLAGRGAGTKRRAVASGERPPRGYRRTAGGGRRAAGRRDRARGTLASHRVAGR